MYRLFLGIAIALLAATTRAEAPIFRQAVAADFDAVYQRVYQALEENRFFVVFEPNIGGNLSSFAERWGDDYNRNQLEEMRSMVFCNAWYANQVTNADPAMAALCPLHISLIHKEGETTVFFLRPDAIAKGTAAETIAKQLTDDVITALRQGLAGFE